MDFSKFKVHDWLMIGGGAAMLLLGLLLDWTSVNFAGFSTSGDGPFNYFFTGGIAWILVVGVGVLALLNQLGKLPPTQPWPLIFLGASGLAAILMVLRILLGARFDGADRGIGMYGAVVWTGISLAGAIMNFTASGGDRERPQGHEPAQGELRHQQARRRHAATPAPATSAAAPSRRSAGGLNPAPSAVLVNFLRTRVRNKFTRTRRGTRIG